MSKMKDLRKQMKKQLKEFEEQIETFGEQADAVEAATLKRSQERLVNLVDAMDAQLKVWQNAMTQVSANTNGVDATHNAAISTTETPTETTTEAVTESITESITATTIETNAVWNSMQAQIKQWLTTTATVRMEVGADALWQLEALRALDATAGEKLRALKKAQNGAQDTLQATAEQALDDLKHALERVLPE